MGKLQTERSKGKNDNNNSKLFARNRKWKSLVTRSERKSRESKQK